MTMISHYRSLFFLFTFCLLFTACRNEPNLSNDTWDKTVKIRIPADPNNLHYLNASDGESVEVLHRIFLQFANFDPVTYEMIPVLAKTLPKVTEITEGTDAGLVSYEFEIREEATWANGSPITANDYLSTLKTMFNPHKRSLYASQYKNLVRVELDKDNPRKFTVFSKPYMMANAAYSAFSPLPAYIYDPKGILAKYELVDLMDKERLLDKMDLKELAESMYSPEFVRSATTLQGSGAYQLESWITGQQLVLKKRGNWWGDKVQNGNRLLKAIPEKIIYKIIPDENAAISLMANEELDIMTKVNWTAFLNQKKKKPFADKYNFYNPDLFGIRLMYFNTLTDKLGDKRVRRAIAHLMDREEIFNTVFYGYPTAVDQPVISAMPAYNKDLPPITYDVIKAKQLLTEAGWEDTNNNGIVDKVINGELVELEIEVSFAIANEDYPAVVDIFRSNALEAGVKITPKALEGNAYRKNVVSRNFDMAFYGYTHFPFNYDPENRWASNGRRNYSGFGSGISDQQIQEIKATIDPGKQNALFKKLYAIIYEEQPCLFISTDKDRIIVSKKFGEITTQGISPGFIPNELDGNALALSKSSQN